MEAIINGFFAIVFLVIGMTVANIVLLIVQIRQLLKKD